MQTRRSFIKAITAIISFPFTLLKAKLAACTYPISDEWKYKPDTLEEYGYPGRSGIVFAGEYNNETKLYLRGHCHGENLICVCMDKSAIELKTSQSRYIITPKPGSVEAEWHQNENESIYIFNEITVKVVSNSND